MVNLSRYHERKYAVYLAVAARNQLAEIRCEDCGVIWQGFDGDIEIHVDHLNEEDGHPDVSGGMQHLYLLEEDVRNNVDMTLRCKKCHEARHNRALFSEGF